jgi:hypothetical protein
METQRIYLFLIERKGPAVGYAQTPKCNANISQRQFVAKYYPSKADIKDLD